jgi:hypothetical protein
MKNYLLISALAISLQVSASIPEVSTPIQGKQIVTNDDFEFIRGHKQGKSGLTLQWKMNNNSNVQYFEVQCTYEDPMDEYSNWTVLGHVDNFVSPLNKFTDQPIYSGILNYRIVAVLKNGAGIVNSPIFTTVID